MVELTVVFESEVGASTVAWEQGMWLLLSASDLEMPVQAVFLRPVAELGALPEGLGKKLQQFDLYEIPSYGLEAGGGAAGAAGGDVATGTAGVDVAAGAAGPVGAGAVGAVGTGGTVGAGTAKACANQLDWSWVQPLAGSKLAERMEQSKQIITV